MLESLLNTPTTIPFVFCLIVGCLLVLAELFMPGFGLPGICGSALLIGAVLLKAQTLSQAVAIVSILLIVLAIVFAFTMHSAARGRIWRSPLILHSNETVEAGYRGTMDYSALLGSQGETSTVLRPAGRAAINGETYDVVSDAEYLEKGTPIHVVEVNGSRIVVRPTQNKA